MIDEWEELKTWIEGRVRQSTPDEYGYVVITVLGLVNREMSRLEFDRNKQSLTEAGY